jgi:carboxyl-terminal processing protease
MKKKQHSIWIIGFALIMLGLGMMMGLIIGCQWLVAFTPSDKIPADAENHYRLIAEAWNTVHRVYVDRKAIDPQNMTYGAISGMVDALGDTGHSRFLTPEMVEQEESYAKGKLEGIGAELRMKNDQLVIVAPLDDSPAQKAGLRAGEIILKVNGEEVSNLPLERAVARIMGPAGSSVALTILNPKTGSVRDVNLVRAKVILRNVTWQRQPGTPIAHIRIAIFSKGVTKDLRKVLLDIQREKLGAIILDLRNNPGGLFDEAVGTASQFLDRGNVLFEKDAGGKLKPVPVSSGGMAYFIPMVVLVNQGTASAPEIVAGALQDAQRATLIGEKTFGTGTVLEKFPLSDSSALMLAIEEWLTPSGRTIWHKGISPDINVSLPPDIDPLFPGTKKDITPMELRNSGDKQLLRALDLLTHSIHKKLSFQRAHSLSPYSPLKEDIFPSVKILSFHTR